MTDLANAQEAAYQKELHKNCVPKSMTDISWRESFEKKLVDLATKQSIFWVNNKNCFSVMNNFDFTDALEEIIESLLAEAKREVIEDMYNIAWNLDWESYGTAIDDLKQQLRSKYLTSTGNLDQ